MRILWISSIAWKNNGNYPYPVNGAGAVAGSLFQQSIIEELEILGHSVDIIADYPYAKGENIGCEFSFKHKDTADDIAVKTIDIPYFSLFYKAKSLKNVVKRKKKNDYDVAIAYLVHQPFMSAISYLKRISPNTKIILICPDLPDMMDMSLKEKKLKSLLKKLDMKRVSKLYKKIDGYVLFSSTMRERINNNDALYTTIEGVATVDDLDVTPVKKENFIMYAGTLHKNFGIENIIESLNYVDDVTLKLKIYGNGELESYIKNISRDNPRVIYGGFIDRQTLFEEEKKALALINARNPQDVYTKYSFPSKTFEYLYSGTPFITTKLKGVPEEYSKLMFETRDNRPESIAERINQVAALDKEQLEKHAKCTRDFVINKKNRKIQTQKLVAFLNEL